ncbi:MAG: SDR family oxidoreductase [Clostridia bacterium]|nr:SDR family oxidoreductase [Clostridia bacterium]
MGSSSNRKETIWLTGASSGLGLSCARAFVKAGCNVAAGARSFTASEGVTDEAGHHIPLDVTSDESVRGFTEKALALYGPPDVLVLCAGILILGPYEAYTLDEIHRVMDTDFYGMVRTVQAALPLMRKNGGGKIICFSSINGLLGIPYQGAYTSAKHAVEGFCESLSMEVRPFGIQVTLIEPGDHRSGSSAYRAHAVRVAESSAYHPSFDNVTAVIRHDEENGSDPERLGKKVVRLSRRKRMPLRRRIASPDQHLAVFLHRVLPGRFFSSIIASYYRTYRK